MTPISIAAYLALFTAVGLAFLFANLLVGRFLRANDPHAEKLEVYECGEPTIGSSFVQFDLRFYVVALLFIIFDVEVAFFFPWATVFGKSTQMADPRLMHAIEAQGGAGLAGSPASWTDAQRQVFSNRTDELIGAKLSELGMPGGTMDTLLSEPVPGAAANAPAVQELFSSVALVSVADILVFFAVLMVGFFYVWRRGDLDWVRAVSRDRAGAVDRSVSQQPAEKVPVLSA